MDPTFSYGSLGCGILGVGNSLTLVVLRDLAVQRRSQEPDMWRRL